MADVVIQIIGRVRGGSSPIDGQWLVEYDPTRPGVDPSGRPMLAHLVCSPDRSRALRLPNIDAARELWRRPSGRTGPDGQVDRPFTAFNVAVELA